MPLDDNVDRDEIAKFEKLASRWWDPNSEFKPLHDINPLRADWIDQHADVKAKTYWMWAAVAGCSARHWRTEAPPSRASIWEKRRWR